jgi:hypothetical protein
MSKPVKNYYTPAQQERQQFNISMWERGNTAYPSGIPISELNREDSMHINNTEQLLGIVNKIRTQMEGNGKAMDKTNSALLLSKIDSLFNDVVNIYKNMIDKNIQDAPVLSNVVKALLTDPNIVNFFRFNNIVSLGYKQLQKTFQYLNPDNIISQGIVKLNEYRPVGTQPEQPQQPQQPPQFREAQEQLSFLNSNRIPTIRRPPTIIRNPINTVNETVDLQRNIQNRQNARLYQMFENQERENNNNMSDLSVRRPIDEPTTIEQIGNTIANQRSAQQTNDILLERLINEQQAITQEQITESNTLNIQQQGERLLENEEREIARLRAIDQKKEQELREIATQIATQRQQQGERLLENEEREIARLRAIDQKKEQELREFTNQIATQRQKEINDTILQNYLAELKQFEGIDDISDIETQAYKEDKSVKKQQLEVTRLQSKQPQTKIEQKLSKQASNLKFRENQKLKKQALAQTEQSEQSEQSQPAQSQPAQSQPAQSQPAQSQKPTPKQTKKQKEQAQPVQLTEAEKLVNKVANIILDNTPKQTKKQIAEAEKAEKAQNIKSQIEEIDEKPKEKVKTTAKPKGKITGKGQKKDETVKKEKVKKEKVVKVKKEKVKKEKVVKVKKEKVVKVDKIKKKLNEYKPSEIEIVVPQPIQCVKVESIVGNGKIKKIVYV